MSFTEKRSTNTSQQANIINFEAKSKTSCLNIKVKHADILALFSLPFADLLFKAQLIHRENFNANAVQRSTLLSIKTGGCPENCSYCPQSAHYETEVKASKIMDLASVIEAAKVAKEAGATRFCMGAAFRAPKDSDIEKVNAMVKAIKELGLETCATLGLLKEHQANSLKEAGLDYYNHNLDTSPDFYTEIITTRNFEDRLQTLEHVRSAGMKVCCGGIIGMGETREQRAALIASLASLDPPPESVPINSLVQVEGTPLHGIDKIDEIEFVRTIACARIAMPKSYVRLSAGRQEMSETTQALCFLAGANSIFYGEKLLTTDNPQVEKDKKLFDKLGITSI
jgi:biotin synthase